LMSALAPERVPGVMDMEQLSFFHRLLSISVGFARADLLDSNASSEVPGKEQRGISIQPQTNMQNRRHCQTIENPERL